MNTATRGPDVRSRVVERLRALEAEDLEERVAPVKCRKHPDNPECMDYYGAPAYMAPEPDPAER